MLFNNMIMLKSLLERQKIMVLLVIFKKFICVIKGGPLGVPLGAPVNIPPLKDPRRKSLFFWSLLFMGLAYTIYQQFYPDLENEDNKEDQSGSLNY